MERDSTLRLRETTASGAATRRGAAHWLRGALSSRDLAVKVCVASVAALVLGRLGPIAAVGGVAVSLVVESMIERALRRLRKRELWGIGVLALLLDRADKALAAFGLRGRRSAAASSSATIAAMTVAGTIVVIGFTIPEAALGHSLVGVHRLTFFGGDGHRHGPPLPPTRLQVPDGVVVKAQGPTAVSYPVRAYGVGGGAVPVGCRPASGATFPIGKTTVSCTAGSTHGSFPVTVVRADGPPLSFPSSVTVEAGGHNGAHVPYAVRSKVGATVRCLPASRSLFPLGRTQVNCAASARGLVTHAVFAVMVVDSSRPVISVPETVQTSTTGAAVTLPYTPTAHDTVDGVVPVTCSPPPGSPFPIGTTLVTCTAEDAHQNVAKRTFAVIVTHADQPLPTLVLPSVGAAEATGPDGAYVEYSVTAHEGVTPLKSTCRPSSGSLFPLGTTRIECSASDARGRRTVGAFSITVRDSTPPALRIPADIEREATSRTGAAVAYSVSATDLVSGSINAACSPNSGATFPIKTTTVVCTAKDDQGRVAVRSFSVRVFDGPPRLTVPDDVTVSAVDASGSWAKYPPAIAADRIDSRDAVSCLPVSGSKFALGTTEVRCEVTDSGGTTVRGSFHVNVKDLAKPALTVPTRPLAASAGVPFSFDKFIRAMDNVDASVSVSCTPSSGTAFSVGSHVVDCTATDAAGNRASASFSVVATDQTGPVLTVPSSPVTAAIGSTFSYSKLVSAIDAIDGPVAVLCKPAPGFVVVAGTQTVSCTAADAAGNATRGSFTVVGKDPRQPAPSVPTRR